MTRRRTTQMANRDGGGRWSKWEMLAVAGIVVTTGLVVGLYEGGPFKSTGRPIPATAPTPHATSQSARVPSATVPPATVPSPRCAPAVPTTSTASSSSPTTTTTTTSNVTTTSGGASTKKASTNFVGHFFDDEVDSPGTGVECGPGEARSLRHHDDDHPPLRVTTSPPDTTTTSPPDTTTTTTIAILPLLPLPKLLPVLPF